MSQLVLSLFPGIGLLDMAFEAEGFCVVRGPDLLWGGDVHRFHVPYGKFDGIIGGPPCKGESNLAFLNGKPGVTLRDEFMRVREESGAQWFVMEAVKAHADLCAGVNVVPLSPRWLGQAQSRRRFFHSDLPIQKHVETEVFEPREFKHAVLAGHGPAVGKVQNGIAKYPWPEHCALQGLPETFDLPGFTRTAAYEAVGNGVPLPMGRAIARAVMLALATQAAAELNAEHDEIERKRKEQVA